MDGRLKDTKKDLLRLLEGLSKGQQPITLDWESIIGPELSEHSRILEIDKNVLKIGVGHAGWKNLVLMKKREIFCALSKLYPDSRISKIVIVIDNDTARVAVKEQKTDTPTGVNDLKDLEFKEFLEKVRKRAEERDNELT